MEVINARKSTKVETIDGSATIQGMPFTEKDKEQLRLLLRGEISCNKAVEGIIDKITACLDEKLLAQQTAHEAEIKNARMDAASETLLAGIEYASMVQRNALPPDSMFEDVFLDYSIIWSPRDIVGGDIYWMKQFDEGVVLCVGDCTGHGTSGALLTVLVVSALEAEVNVYNYRDTADIVWRLDEQISRVFEVSADERAKSGVDIKNGCDMAVLYIPEDGDISLSSGHTRVLICNGKEVRQIKGQKIYIGEGKLKSKYGVETIHIEANENNKFYIASDGLFDQPGGANGTPFGYRRINPVILDNHDKKLSNISDAIWDVYEEYRGKNPRVDDFELISFMPRTSSRMSYEF